MPYESQTKSCYTASSAQHKYINLRANFDLRTKLRESEPLDLMNLGVDSSKRDRFHDKLATKNQGTSKLNLPFNH